MLSLFNLGWKPFFEDQIDKDATIEHQTARVIWQQRQKYRLMTASGETWGELSGKFQYLIDGPEDLPVVGDWVVITPTGTSELAIIERVLARKSHLARLKIDSNRQGPGGKQVLAANVDLAYIFQPLDQKVNFRRLERFVALAHDGGVEPLILLTKADLADDIEGPLAELHKLWPSIEAIGVSTVTSSGLERARARLEPGTSAVFLGPSGAGKSSLLNALAGQPLQLTSETRASDGKGRHTTTNRQLFQLPVGGLIIDTPGIRSVALSGEAGELDLTFADIEALAAGCRFRDCRHQDEPGCAVLKAVKKGLLKQDRLIGYLKLQKEVRHEQIRHNPVAQKRRNKKLSQMVKEVKKIDKRKY